MLRYISGWFTTYSTPKQVQIKSRLLAVTYLLLIITVLVAYIGSLQMDLRNIYQKSCPVQGAILSKIKGQLSTEDIPSSDFAVPNPKLYQRVWDTSDLIFGGDGSDGSFIAVTNVIITPNQTRGLCAESIKVDIANCTKDADCKKGRTSPVSSGVQTGRCLVNETRTCEVSAWCPVEQSTKPLRTGRALLEGVKDFTIMLKNSVEFPECGKELHYRNIISSETSGDENYLASCIYEREKDVTCPIFRLSDVIAWSNASLSDVALTGGVFRIEAIWNCDFDWGFTNNRCFPKYEFERIDESRNGTISPGWNFRTSFYHEENRRTLIKMYGLKVLVVVSGNGRQFDFLQLILAFGATIGLFSVAPLFCDNLFEFLCFLKRFGPFGKCFGDLTVKSKYQDAGQVGPSDNRFELSASNNTIDESVGSYKPSP